MKNIEANRFNLYAGIITSGLFAMKKLTDHINEKFRNILWFRRSSFWDRTLILNLPVVNKTRSDIIASPNRAK